METEYRYSDPGKFVFCTNKNSNSYKEYSVRWMKSGLIYSERCIWNKFQPHFLLANLDPSIKASCRSLSLRDLWIDHCSLSHCKDGLIDAVMGSTAITISNNWFSHHNEVMLLGHSDAYLPDSGMQVTIAFNHFGQKLVQRMPRCRRGYIHVVNNDFTQWEMYAIGGSGNPTINSQGNRYIAPFNYNAKEVSELFIFFPLHESVLFIELSMFVLLR